MLGFLSEAPIVAGDVTPSGAHLRRACKVLITLRLSEPLGISDALLIVAHILHVVAWEWFTLPYDFISRGKSRCRRRRR